MNRFTLLTAVAIATILPAATASAHVTVQPSEAAAGGFTVLDVRVPNERDDAGTVKVDVQLPDGFAFVSYEPVDGWKTTVKREKAPEPIDVEGTEITEQVAQVTFTATGDNAIAPGQFRDFPLSVRVPDGDEGTKLTFKALQTYEGGEVVRWIGAEDAEEPAPVVTLTASEGDHGGGAAHEEDAAAAPEATPAPAPAEEDGNGLAIAGVALGGAGFLLGGAALASTRKT